MSDTNEKGKVAGGARLVAHVLSNVFLGIAIGLASYYGITDLSGRAEQAELDRELDSLGSIGAEDPAALVIEEGSALDLAGWTEKDEPFWQGLENGGAFGRIVIPKIELDAVVIKGHTPQNLKRGPAWVDYTDLPGATGNCGISGHRTTYGAPFRRIDQLAPGDTIDLYSPFRRYRYEVERVFQVEPDAVEVMDSTEEPYLTLTACHPPYSARYRIVVRAKMIEASPLEQDPDS